MTKRYDVVEPQSSERGEVNAQLDAQFGTQLRKLSHDVKNALHGVSVNLEVARARAARGTVDKEQLVPFLESAAQQLEAATALHKKMYEHVAALMAPPAATPPTKTEELSVPSSSTKK